MKKLFSLFFLIGAITAQAGTGTYSGLNPKIFLPQREGIVTSNDSRIVAPGKRWEWFNSWHIIRFAPGVFNQSRGNGPYTLTNSCDILKGMTFQTYTWAHYSYFLYKGNLPEEYGGATKKVEDTIWKKYHQPARVIRIDKISPNLYVAMYVRSQVNFNLMEIEGYPPFHLNKNVTIGTNKINVWTRNVRTVIPVYSPSFLLLLANPELSNRPIRKKITVPYRFFRKKHIYEYGPVKEGWEIFGDPLLVGASSYGVIFYF